MKIVVHAEAEHVKIIQELLSIWNVSYTKPENSDIVIVYGKNPSKTSKKTIVIPSNSALFNKWIQDAKLRVTKKAGEQISVTATPKIALAITPKIFYEYDRSVAEKDEELVFLTLDVVKEYEQILHDTLCAKSSVAYRLLTSLPLPYNKAPKQFRDLFMRQSDQHENSNICDVLPLDALRFALVGALEELSGEKIRRKTWNQKACACILTHDIETKEGLKESRKVKKIEKKYDVPSAWFIPSAQYSLEHDIIKELENNGEIGSHDTKHDGRLFNLSGKKLNKRLNDSKKTIESMTKCPVEGFRAPLLQHGPNIFRGLKECGYTYDSSIPTWEAKHPRTMQAHGIGTVFPTYIEGIKEIPITIMQDHQFLHVMNYTPKEVIAEWLSTMSVIKELGGICVFLSHPEYALLSNDLSLYEELLNVLTSDDDMLVALPIEMVPLWAS